MEDTNPPASEDVKALMARIRDKSALIVTQQQRADAGKFKDYGGAIGLQRLRQQRKQLQASLPALRLISNNA
jgi:hypothetical protein